IKVNDIFEKYTGLKNNNLIGKTIIQTSLEIEFSWLANCDEVDQTGKLKHFIDFNKTTRRWHEVFCFPYENNKVGILFKDITNKVQVREALYRSGKRYKAFMMACFDSVYSISSDWSQINIVKEKGAFVDIQKSDSDWMKKYIHSDDRLYITNEINKAILNKSVFDLEHRTLKEDGSLGWAHLRAVPITNNNGDIVEWLGSVSDITLKKEFELKLIEREKEYIEILDSSILGSYIRDFEMKECYVSGIWKKRLGLEDLNSSEIFFEYSRVHHPEDSERIEMFKTNSIKEKRSKFSVEYRVKTIDSGYIWVLGQTKVIYNEQGKPIKSYGTHIDITDRMLAEEALRNSEKKARELIAKLRKASEHKKDFISTLSHELRNPLATITMALSLTEHVVSGSNQDVSMREIIKCQTTQLIRLVDDLLDVTRIGRNKIELTKGNIEINEVVREVLEEFKVQFNENGVVLENEYYADPLYVNADIVRIKQVISNLLSNSLKFTEKRGAVRLTVSKDDDRNVVIKISDTGIGIDPELLPDLFEPFVQADNSPARSAGGLGLGLSIVKGIIDLHGGSIVAKSEGLGKGAKFIIKFPLLPCKQSISS
ncbi:MAG TPA: PAS domain-containing sensor histidine kinase, partial [Oscillospiraceae bacterium]|nr:PAS domain-containing sensor histidine kinase [Oscillospiraceae bacterium]